jgi:hypothetical protein
MDCKSTKNKPLAKFFLKKFPAVFRLPEPDVFKALIQRFIRKQPLNLYFAYSRSNGTGF